MRDDVDTGRLLIIQRAEKKDLAGKRLVQDLVLEAQLTSSLKRRLGWPLICLFVLPDRLSRLHPSHWTYVGAVLKVSDRCVTWQCAWGLGRWGSCCWLHDGLDPPPQPRLQEPGKHQERQENTKKDKKLCQNSISKGAAQSPLNLQKGRHLDIFCVNLFGDWPEV